MQLDEQQGNELKAFKLVFQMVMTPGPESRPASRAGSFAPPQVLKAESQGPKGNPADFGDDMTSGILTHV